MPHHHHHHHYYGRHGNSNPICSLIYCSILIGVFIVIIWNTTGFSSFGYFTPFFGIIIFIAVSGIIAAIVNTARRNARMKTQPVGSVTSPTGYPQQGYPPQAGVPGTQGFQPVSYSTTPIQPVPQPRPVGIPQPQAQYPVPAPASPSRFCTYCGTTVESGDQRFCANCGAAL
jgi:hypothetical protein